MAFFGQEIVSKGARKLVVEFVNVKLYRNLIVNWQAIGKFR